MSQTPENLLQIPEKLKRLRQLRNFSLRELAEKSECSASFLSKLELGRAAPTVPLLDRICTALGTNLSDFVRPEVAFSRSHLIPHKGLQRRALINWSNAKLEQFLPAEANQSFTALVLTLEPQGQTSLRAAEWSMPELGVILKGSVTFFWDGTTQLLKQSDSVLFDLQKSHQWKNESQEQAEILLVNPYHFHLFEGENIRVVDMLRSPPPP